MLKDHCAIRAHARLRRARLALVFALVSGAALILAACGGGGGGSPISLKTSEQPSYLLGAIGASSSGGVGANRGQGVAVAVIDGEFDTGHLDLAGAFRRDAGGQVQGHNVREGHSDVRPVEQRISNPRPGIAEVASLDEKRQAEQRWEADFSKGISHGTHVAGIIGARNNGIGTVGVAPEAEIVPIVLFRDFYIPSKHLAWGSADPATYLQSNQRVAAAVNFARAQNVFIINNSWGRNRVPIDVKFPNSERYFHLYNLFPDNPFAHADIFDQRATTAWEAAANEGRVIVFAAGNEGWNGETGQIDIYARPINRDSRDENVPIDQVSTSPGLPYVRRDGQQIALPENIPSLESSFFLTSASLRGRWLAVVNVDKRNVIARSSNGCGIAMEFCLAAPGTYVQSSFASGEKYDQKDSPGRTSSKRRYGDADIETGDGYGTYSGTSMAAPAVSGAAAVVKSAAPHLTAREVVDILLRTATDLGAPGTDPVYGRGLVNLARALQPIGAQNAAGGLGQAVAPSADTRIAFSSAFGNAAPSATHHFGGFDSYGRVYRYRAPLQDRVLQGPRLSGVLALNRAEGPVPLASGQGITAMLRHSTVPESTVGDGTAVSFIGARHRTGLSIARRKASTALSPASLMSRDDRGGTAGPDWQGVWQGLVPTARDVFSGETDWQLAGGISAGAYFSRAMAEGATRRGEAYGLTDLGIAARFGSENGGKIGIRAGRLSEQGRFLGSKPEGAFALSRPTRTGYLHVSAERRLSDRVSVGANLMQLRAQVDFRHDSFVRDTTLKASSAGAHLALRDAAQAGDRLTLQYGQPLAVTGGAIRQSSVMGYTGSGAYRVDDTVLDLGVRKRHRMAQVMYRVPLAGGISGFAAAAHHRNWSHRGGLDNNLVMFGLSVQR